MTPLQGDELISTYSKLNLLRHDQVFPDAHMAEPEVVEQVPFASGDLPGILPCTVDRTQLDDPAAADMEVSTNPGLQCP